MKALRHFRPIVRDLCLNSFVFGRLVPSRLRGRLLSLTGHNIHPSATVNADGFVGSHRGLTVGAESFINYGCFFDLGAPTTIGANSSVGYETMFVSCSHEIGPPSARTGKAYASPIVVGDGVWIGARVTVLPGVTIGDGCVIASGAVVTADCESHFLYAGVPAKKVRALDPPFPSVVKAAAR